MGVSATQPQTLTKNMAHLVDLFGHILSLNRVFEILKWQPSFIENAQKRL